MGVEKEGAPVSACFLVSDAQNPAVAELRRYRSEITMVWIDDLVQRFNVLPLQVRTQHYARHQKLSQMPDREWTAEDRVFMQDWFPSQAWVDASTLMMRNSLAR